MAHSVSGCRWEVQFLLKVSRELSGVVNHLGGKPSSRPTRSAILCRNSNSIYAKQNGAINCENFVAGDTLGATKFSALSDGKRSNQCVGE